MARHILRGMTLLLAIAGLGGCTRNGPPAPVEIHGQQRYDRSTTIAQATATETEPGVAVIRTGDTLYSVARRHNTPMRAIIDANRLDPPYVLQPGQRLVLPRVRTHVVRVGDTMHGISRRYDVEMSSLVRANAIAAPYNIQIGQTLILPGAAAAPGAAVQTAAITTIPAPVREPDPAPAPAAAPRGAIESAPLAPVAPAPQAAPVHDAPAAAPVASAPAPVLAPPPPPARAEVPDRTPEQMAQVEPAATATALPARAGRVFLWPVSGRVISDFGPKGSGMHNDGINIAAAKGTSIRAAENGIVVYAGNELRGFGNLLLLRHADGWMTAYAHADEILVARGHQVRRGQVIGRVGATGNVNAPQLHFEIRRGSRALNPREYLASSTASSG